MESDRSELINLLKAFKEARDGHQDPGDVDTLAEYTAASLALAERLGEERVPMIEAMLDMHGEALIEAFANTPEEDEPEEPTPFGRAMSDVEDEKIMEACAELGLDFSVCKSILMAVDQGRAGGRDELAEHGQDARALVAFHLELMEEARVHGRSRGY